MKLQQLLPLALSALPFLVHAAPSRDRSEAVREAFLHSWNGYKTYAWGADELKPVTKKGGNSRNGWGASIADALSTSILMELEDEVLEQLEFLVAVDFTKAHTPDTVSLFETTIRYIGGLLSGYDLLTGPYASLIPNSKRGLVHKLLDQVKTLADRLAFAFNTPTGIPYNNLHFDTNTSDDKTNGLATIGTLVLEWTHLSDLTGNKTYADLAQRAESYLLHPSLDKVGGPPYPGLLGSNVNISTGEFTDANGGWGGGTDSYYEYLLKMYIYSPSRFPEYLTRWIAAVDGTITHLIAPGTRGFVSEYTAPPAKLHPEEGHLTCFMAGNFILGGDLISRNDIKSAGLWLTQGCHTTYLNSPSGVGPERWSWDRTKVPSEYAAFYAKHGWYPTNNYYQLRPEVVESYYHAYRLTGNPVYREWAWEAFVAIDAMCRTEVGYTGVENIMHKDGGERSDFMESFWFAEVLKYLWLIFSEGVEGGKVGIVKGRGDWVFNTEAHPLRVAAA